MRHAPNVDGRVSEPSWDRRLLTPYPAAAPAEIRIEVVQQVRDEIADRLCQFLLAEVRVTPAALQCYCCKVQLEIGCVS